MPRKKKNVNRDLKLKGKESLRESKNREKLKKPDKLPLKKHVKKKKLE